MSNYKYHTFFHIRTTGLERAKPKGSDYRYIKSTFFTHILIIKIYFADINFSF